MIESRHHIRSRCIGALPTVGFVWLLFDWSLILSSFASTAEQKEVVGLVKHGHDGDVAASHFP
jgi:hypothetical protein